MWTTLRLPVCTHSFSLSLSCPVSECVDGCAWSGYSDLNVRASPSMQSDKGRHRVTIEPAEGAKHFEREFSC